MEAELLKTVGQIAGIGGLALGVFLLLFRDIIRKNIFPKLPPAETYRLLRLITVAVWSIAVIGIVAWLITGMQFGASVKTGDCGIAAAGSASNNSVNCGSAPPAPATKP